MARGGLLAIVLLAVSLGGAFGLTAAWLGPTPPSQTPKPEPGVVGAAVEGAKGTPLPSHVIRELDPLHSPTGGVLPLIVGLAAAALTSIWVRGRVE